MKLDHYTLNFGGLNYKNNKNIFRVFNCVNTCRFSRVNTSNQRVIRTTVSTLVSHDFLTIHTLYYYFIIFIISRIHATLYVIPLKHCCSLNPIRVRRL